MKLLKLRLKNLNSLVGEWSIDFEHPDYVANGLFAITGPTGAGKSTLLDAISLALYGRTPRLGTISMAANEIMSRDCGECFAEVTFQSTQGLFRAHWSQRRARSKGDGNLQAAKHELTDVLSNKIVTAKRNETYAVIQESVGLDYEQFMRSIMLAQGDFATFLKSDDRVRAGILAKITGTDIYARIGMAVFQRQRSEAEAIQLLDLQSSAIELLSPEAIDEMVGKIGSINQQFDGISDLRKTTEVAVNWLERINNLDRDLSRLNEELRIATVSLEASRPKREMLDKAQRASSLSRSLESLRNLQLKIAATEKTLDESKRGLSESESRKQSIHKRLELSKIEIVDLSELIEKSRPQWQETRDLDLRIANESTILEQAKKQVDSIRNKYEAERKEKEALDVEHDQITAQLASLRVYQAENARDTELLATLPVVEHLGAEWKVACELELRLESDLKSFAVKSNSFVQEEQDARALLQSALKSVADAQLAISSVELQRAEVMDGRSTEEIQFDLDAASVSRNAIHEWIGLFESSIALEGEQFANLEELTKTKSNIGVNKLALDTVEHQIEQQSELIAAYEASLLKDRLIASLQEHRSRLISGQPCELCGSTEHPWAHDYVDPGPETESALAESKEKQKVYLALRSEKIRDLDRNVIRVTQLENQLQESETKLQIVRADLASIATRHMLDLPIQLSSLEPARLALVQQKSVELKLQEKLKEANSHLEKIARLQVNLAALQAELTRAELAVQSSVNSRLAYEASQQKISKELDEHRISVVAKRAELCAMLNRLGEPWSDDWASLSLSLKFRLVTWQDAVQKILELEKKALLLGGNLAAITSKIEQSQQYLVDCQEKQRAISSVLETLHQSRKKLFGEDDPHAAELELQSTLKNRTAEFEQLAAEHETIIDEWQILDRQVVQMQSTVDADKIQAKLQQTSLDDELTNAGFIDVTELESSLQPESQIEEWGCELKSLEEAVRTTTSLVEQKSVERAELRTLELTIASIENLRLQIDEIDIQLESLRVERIHLQNRVSENKAKSDELQQSQLILEAQKQKMQRWSALNKLIGSADGAKFRSFAQGITFELLLAYANIQLTKLTDRYLLKKGDEGLSLVVIDHYQSSRPRSASNLSGGESFLVSLALALGLSKLASQNVQIDSLFLDEGFGTLDEETLEEALHTLSNLRQEGKLVGLISHVPALNQQIPIRIEVLKGPMGRSRLRGPGIT